MNSVGRKFGGGGGGGGVAAAATAAAALDPVMIIRSVGPIR